jgi:hypothetical protein
MLRRESSGSTISQTDKVRNFSMSNYLRGSFEPKGDVEVPGNNATSTFNNFEDAALRRLGGSIAYFSRKKFLWQGEDEDPAETSGDGVKDKV